MKVRAALMSTAATGMMTAENNVKVAGSLGEPKMLWQRFGEIASIPRPSGKEEAILAYLSSLAKERSLEARRDATGNLMIRVPGEGRPVLIQGHVDMVTEKNGDTVHDFDVDGIGLRAEAGDEWLYATGTTLGADNGIGVAAALALLDEDGLPPLELLFTVDEESGLTGARMLDAETLGLTATNMLNLDTEEWGSLYVGCAGGGDMTFRFPTTLEDKERKVTKIVLKGATGGHSGVDIHRGRCNAIKELAALLPGAQIVTFFGGDKRNAIPREATAFVDGAFDSEACLSRFESRVKPRFPEEELELIVEEEKEMKGGLSQDSSDRFLNILNGLTHGVVKMSEDIEDLVETSSNVAAVKMSDDSTSIDILCSTRSSIGPDLEAVRDNLVAVAEREGARVVHREVAYPGWKPKMDSRLLEKAKEVFQTQTSQTPEIKAIHAGLECGLLIERMQHQVEAISFGPTIENAHTPTERLKIGDVEKFYAFLKSLLVSLK